MLQQGKVGLLRSAGAHRSCLAFGIRSAPRLLSAITSQLPTQPWLAPDCFHPSRSSSPPAVLHLAAAGTGAQAGSWDAAALARAQGASLYYLLLNLPQRRLAASPGVASQLCPSRLNKGSQLRRHGCQVLRPAAVWWVWPQPCQRRCHAGLYCRKFGSGGRQQHMTLPRMSSIGAMLPTSQHCASHACPPHRSGSRFLHTSTLRCARSNSWIANSMRARACAPQAPCRTQQRSSVQAARMRQYLRRGAAVLTKVAQATGHCTAQFAGQQVAR